MTDFDETDAAALSSRLDDARANATRLRSQIVNRLLEGEGSLDVLPTATVLEYIRGYSSAIFTVTCLEAQIGKHSSAKYDVVQGDGTNLDDARREVIDRITRFRERSGD